MSNETSPSSSTVPHNSGLQSKIPGALTRRDALKALAAGGLTLLLPRKSSAQAASTASPAAQPMRLAFVGLGGQGHGHAKLLADHRYIAFCDVDDVNAADTYREFPDVPRYRDYLQMLEQHGSDIDAVIISTPDHAHFPVAMNCMAAGKHIYVEKPLAPTPWECRELERAAKRYKVRTQLGIQGHSTSGLRMLREWIDAGVAGKIETVFLWTDRMQPQRYHWSETLAPAEVVPSTLDWKRWLSGRPDRPYNHEYVPNRWRNWWDLGCGPIGDIGVHMFDVLEFALDLGFPDWVEAETPDISDFTAPPWTRARWHFPAKGARGSIDAHWFNGTRDGHLLKPAEVPYVPADVLAELTNGIAIIGTEGTLLVEDMRVTARPRLYPLERERAVLGKQPPRRLPRVQGGHFDDFFRAIRDGTEAGAHFGYGAPLTEMVLLGTLAQRTGKRIQWDRPTMGASGVPVHMIQPTIDPSVLPR